MTSPLITAAVANERRNALLAEAAHERLVAQARRHHPTRQQPRVALFPAFLHNLRARFPIRHREFETTATVASLAPTQHATDPQRTHQRAA
jgi:hypothetical protein